MPWHWALGGDDVAAGLEVRAGLGVGHCGVDVGSLDDCVAAHGRVGPARSVGVDCGGRNRVSAGGHFGWRLVCGEMLGAESLFEAGDENGPVASCRNEEFVGGFSYRVLFCAPEDHLDHHRQECDAFLGEAVADAGFL